MHRLISSAAYRGRAQRAEVGRIPSPLEGEGIRPRAGRVTTELVPFTVAAAGASISGVRGGRGPSALLIHGTAGSWRNFRPWLPTLAPRYHLVIPDLPGFGTSPEPRVEPRLVTWAAFLRTLVSELDAPPRLVVGLGLGASVALTYVERAGHLEAPPLAGLVLHTPAYHPGALRPAVRWAVRAATAPGIFMALRGPLASRSVRDRFVGRFIEGPGTPAEDAQALREDFRRASLSVLRGLLRDMVRADFRPLLRSLETPTLAIASQYDPFVYASEVERLAFLMPSVTVAVQPDLSHGWTPEAIVEQNRLLARFLDAIPELGVPPPDSGQPG